MAYEPDLLFREFQRGSEFGLSFLEQPARVLPVIPGLLGVGHGDHLLSLTIFPGSGRHSRDVGRGRRNGLAVWQQSPHVLERDDAVAQQAPSLLGMLGHHPGGQVIGRRCVWAPGLVFAHMSPPSSQVLGFSVSVPAGVSVSGRHGHLCVVLTLAPGPGHVCTAGTQPSYRPAGSHEAQPASRAASIGRVGPEWAEIVCRCAADPWPFSVTRLCGLQSRQGY